MNIGFITTRYLDLSETFIYEPLKLINKYDPYMFALQKKNVDKFPYNNLFTIDDLDEKQKKKDNFLAAFGREKYLLSKMKDMDIKLLHAHYGYMGYYALQFKKKLKIPLVTIFYGLDVYQHTRSYFYRKQMKKLFHEGDLFLVCSKKMREDLIELGAPPSRTIVHYGGANLDKFTYSYQAINDDTKEINILMCGRFVEKKGFEYGIKAFLHIVKEDDRLRLKIIGSGPLEEHLKSIAAGSLFKDQIIFLGPKTYREYLEELKKAHIFMSPSITAENGDREGLPTVLIEAAALGKPLVATYHSGIPEIVHEGKNGFLSHEKDHIRLGGEICKVLENSYQLEKFTQYGRKLVEDKFDLKKQVAKLQEHYEDLIS